MYIYDYAPIIFYNLLKFSLGFFHLSSMAGCLAIRYAWNPQNTKNPKYTNAAK